MSQAIYVPPSSGSSDSIITTFRAQATAIYYQLRTEHLLKSAHVSAWGWTLPSGTADQVQSALDTVARSMSPLAPGGSLTAKVIAGEAPPSKWQELADVVAESLRYIAQAFGEAMPSISRLYTEVIAPTAKEVGEQVKDVANQVEELLPWIVAGVVALVVGYVVFTFRR